MEAQPPEAAPALLPWQLPQHEVCGELLNRPVRIRSSLGEPNHLAFADGSELSVSGELGQLDIHREGEWLESIVLGPALLLLLAAQQRYCVHASAFVVGGQAWLVMARSGTGKSTLARTAHDLGLARLSDDLSVLGVEPDGEGRLCLFPHYPQIKLSSAQQYPANQRPHWPLAGMVRLERSDALSAARVAPEKALVELVAHSVATRLYPPALLGAHLTFCSQLARAVPLWHLQVRNVPSNPVSAMSEALAAWPTLLNAQ